MSIHDDLLTAARGWRKGLVPKTGTASYSAVLALLSAIEAFDPAPCDHPSSWHVHYPDHMVCGYCGTTLPKDPDTT